MTNKQTTSAAKSPERNEAPEDLTVAYEIHTLAEMIRGRLTASHFPWGTPVPPATPFEPTAAWTSPLAQEGAAPWTVPTHWPW